MDKWRGFASLAAGLAAAALCAGVLRAQDTTGRDTTRRDSTRSDTLPAALLPAPPAAPPPQALTPTPPPPPTPEQLRYMDGLRSVGRGVAQLHDGVERVMRLRQSTDSIARRRAARRLGGLCVSARSFIASGRVRMQPTAYDDSSRIAARQLVVRIDSLVKVLPACEQKARSEGIAVANDLTAKLKSYDEALTAFRAAIANRSDSTRTVSQQ